MKDSKVETKEKVSNTKSNDTKSKGNKSFKGKKPQKQGVKPNETKVTNIAQQRVADVTGLNFDYPISTNLGSMDTGHGSTVGPDITEPNIYLVKYFPTLGASDGANLASQKWFGELRKVLNVPSTYEAGDLFMYIMAVEQLDIAIEHFKRIIRLANTYQQKNILFPESVIQALGFNINEVVANLPAYREAVNKAITAMQYLTIPYVTNSHTLRMNLSHFIYKDSESDKAQNIIFTQEGFWCWNVAAGTSTTPSDLTWVDLTLNSGTNHYDLLTVQTMLKTLTESLLYDTDGQRIHGDILKVWGDRLVLGGAPISESEVQDTQFDPYLLYMLHNATIFDDRGLNVPTISWNIPTGGTSPVIQQYYYVNSKKTVTSKEILDAWEGVTSMDIMNLCRWKAFTFGDYTKSGGALNDFVVDTTRSLPLEILYKMEACTFDLSTHTISKTSMPTVINRDANSFIAHAVNSEPLSMYPIVYVRNNLGTTQTPAYVVVNVIGDRNYYTIIDYSYLLRLGVVATEMNYGL